MREEDPTWVVEQSKNCVRFLFMVRGEFHLRTLKMASGKTTLQIQFYEPKIPYRETSLNSCRYRHKKQSGGAGRFGEVHLIVEPY